jgi:hypothetical protein
MITYGNIMSKPLELIRKQNCKKAKRWREKHKEQSRDASKRWKEKNKERSRDYSKAWLKKNRERRRATNLKWREKNREYAIKRNRDRFGKFSKMFQSGEIKRATEKRCSICKKIKHAHEFYLSNTNNDGLHGWCKECSDRRTVENGRKRLYGISPEQFEKKLQEQKGVCSICHKPEKGKRSLNIDHDHASGKVRGILCSKCNLLLGYSGDNINILMNAIDYLRRWA